MVFMVIVNAAQEVKNEGALNNASNSSSLNNGISEEFKAGSAKQDAAIENSQNKESKENAVTASFGVYLQIEG